MLVKHKAGQARYKVKEEREHNYNRPCGMQEKSVNPHCARPLQVSAASLPYQRLSLRPQQTMGGQFLKQSDMSINIFGCHKALSSLKSGLRAVDDILYSFPHIAFRYL